MSSRSLIKSSMGQLHSKLLHYQFITWSSRIQINALLQLCSKQLSVALQKKKKKFLLTPFEVKVQWTSMHTLHTGSAMRRSSLSFQSSCGKEGIWWQHAARILIMTS